MDGVIPYKILFTGQHEDLLQDINCDYRLNIEDGQRFYNFPSDMVKILDIRCKNHENNDGVYRSIPRSIYQPETEDSDGI